MNWSQPNLQSCGKSKTVQWKQNDTVCPGIWLGRKQKNLNRPVHKHCGEKGTGVGAQFVGFSAIKTSLICTLLTVLLCVWCHELLVILVYRLNNIVIYV